MGKFCRLVVVAALMHCGAVGSAGALDVAPDQFEQKLKTYDPAAVNAARAYAQTFDIKGVLEKSIPQMRAGLTAQLKAKNPQLDEKKFGVFFDAFFKSAFVDDAPVVEKAILLITLDIMSKEELVALNQFYSSPIGKSILLKMPQLMGRLPELNATMEKYVLPRALERARAEVKKSGVDIKI
jgi:hypothetical protein